MYLLQVRPTLSSSSQGEESGASVGDGPTASQHIKGKFSQQIGQSARSAATPLG